MKIKGQRSWDYGFLSWDAAVAHAGRYDDDSIIKKVHASARMVLDGHASYERDSVIFNEIEYSWPLLAALLLAAATKNSLRVIDFGGSLGTTYRQNSCFLKRLSFACQWRVVEQEKFVEIGKNEFTNETLSFYCQIEDAILDGVDVVLFGGSICYVEDPYKYLSDAIKVDAEYIIFDRTPITLESKDTFAVQHVPSSIYKASFPIRTFSQDNLIKTVGLRYELVEKWICDLQADPKSTAMGFIFKRKFSNM